MNSWGMFLSSRILLLMFYIFSSMLSVFTYVPFTYHQVLKANLLPPLNSFANGHAWLQVVVTIMAILSLAIDRPDETPVGKSGRRLRRIWVLLLVVQALFHIAVPMLSRMESGMPIYIVSLVFLLPIAVLSIIDWVEILPSSDWPEKECPEDSVVFRASWQSAVILGLFSAAGVFLRIGFGEWNIRAEIYAVVWNLVSHVMVIMGFFAALNLIAVIAGWTHRPARTEFLFYHVFGAAVAWIAIRTLIFPAITFTGWRAELYGASLAITIALALSGISLRLLARKNATAESGLAVSLWITGKRKQRSLRRFLLVIGATGVVTCFAIYQTSKMDWNYLVQKILVLLTFIIVFRICYAQAFTIPQLRSRSVTLLLTPLAVLACYRGMQATQYMTWKLTGSNVVSGQFLEKYSGYDVSFKLIRDAVTPSQNSDPDFYHYLSRNTNIPRSVVTKPVDVKMVEGLQKAAGYKPNVFVFVVDSLRQDYLAPYNSSVHFTPAVDSFGKESVVFQNSFTHYGGTGLSEPSIWVGGMILHKQYVTPFAPMNALQKLLEADEYTSFISRDTILETIVNPWPKYVPLDQNVTVMDYDLCGSLNELQTKLEASGAPRGGVFAYTQPQNIHISRINREGAKPIDESNYGGFYAPYASRLRRIDGCFGKFIQFLKDKNMYDDSIVVLTADHGDSLGEGGRWGHAYTIYPEILRIPLIIHLPTALKTLFYNKNQVAFSTDITPSLYYMLGHRPVLRHDFLGRPLFTEKPEEQSPYRRDNYLIASSYAAVYGILAGDASKLYVSDGVNYKDYLFSSAIGGFSGSGSTPTASMRAEHQALIKDNVQAIAKWYGLDLH